MIKRSVLTICILPILMGCGFEERIPIEMTSLSRVQPLAKEKSLDSKIRFDLGSLEITVGNRMEELYAFDLEYDKASYKPDIHYETGPSGEEGRFSFNLRSAHKTGIRKQKYNNRIRLAFNKSVPLNLAVEAGVGDARLSLTGMKVKRFNLESGVGGAKIAVYEPNPISCDYVGIKTGVGGLDAAGLGNLDFSTLEFEGGVGGASLDLTGEWKRDADIRIKVGVGGVHLRMPREIGVKVEADKHLLSGVQLEGFTQRDSTYYSGNYETAQIRVFVRVETGIGGLKITWV